MTSNDRLVVASLATFLFLGSTALAQSSFSAIYRDKARFLAETGAMAEPALPYAGLVGVPFQHGSLAFSNYLTGGSTQLFSSEWTSIIPGNELAISGPEHLDIVSNSPIRAIGFSVVEPTGWCGTGPCPCTDTTFVISLISNTHGLVAQYQFGVEDDVLDFVGVASTIPFDIVNVRDLTNTCDDEFFAEFYVADCIRGISYGTLSSFGGLSLTTGPSAPTVGTTYGLRCSSLVAGALGAQLFAAAPGSLQALGMEVLVDPATAFGINFVADGNGQASFQIPIPNSAAVVGTTMFSQSVALDPTAPHGVVASNGMAFTVCQ